MTDLKQLGPHELVERIENRNRRFKIASTIFYSVLTVGLAVLLVLGLDTLTGVNNQLNSQKTLLTSQQKTLSAIQSLSKQQSGQVNDLQNHIDCVVELFQQPNRANLTIKDLDGCTLTNAGVPVTPAGGTSVPQSKPTVIETKTPEPVAKDDPATPIKPVNKLFCKVDLEHLTCKE